MFGEHRWRNLLETAGADPDHASRFVRRVARQRSGALAHQLLRLRAPDSRPATRRGASTTEVLRSLAETGIPNPRKVMRQLPPRALRRHEAAGHDRPGPGLRPRPADRRRAHHRAGRDHPGPDPAPHRGPAGAAGHGRPLHHPRPVAGPAARRPARGDVRRSDRRGRARSTRSCRNPHAPLHPGPARGDPARRYRARRAGCDPRHGPAAGRTTASVPLPQSLPARRRGLPRRRAPARRARRDHEVACLRYPFSGQRAAHDDDRLPEPPPGEAEAR